MPLYVVGIVLMMGSWCIDAIDLGSEAVREDGILDCAHYNEEPGLHSLCNCFANDAIRSHLLLPLLVGKLLSLL
jgi:hypothetical protein